MPSLIVRAIKRLPGVERLGRRLRSAVPYRFRIGRSFFHWYKRFEEAESWSVEQLAAERHALLVSLLEDLKHGHPFYRQRLIGLSAAEAAHRFREIFPVANRDDFRKTPAATALAKRLSPASTSGTTGNALQFFHAVEDDQREWAAICHQWRRIGYDPLRSRRAEFRGLVADGQAVQHFPEYNMLRCSILDLRPRAIRHYADVCRREGIEFLHGYPSALHLLAQVCRQDGISFPQVRGIMLASEMVFAHQVDAIEQAFPKAKLIAHYGNAERVALGAWCEHERKYHMLPLYSLVEAETGGSLIGTNLFNRVNPFLRYRMSDQLTIDTADRCSACGRFAAPLVVSVDGRAEDYLFSPESGWIPPAIVTYPLKGLEVIREVQLVQRTPETLNLRYSATGDERAGLAELQQIVAGLNRVVAGVRVLTERMDQLPRGPNGKLRWIVSELSPMGGREP